jgi:penicillin V acylase-like amidase (Ntn superfamily)
LLFVDKRYVAKTGWDAITTGEYPNWTAKHGGVTFHLVGHKLDWAGMNEAGLTVSTTYVSETRKPTPDERPPL